MATQRQNKIKYNTCYLQTCIAANRILVQDGIMNEYVDKLSKRVDELKLGPGFAEGVNQGPLINHPAIDKVCYCIYGYRIVGTINSGFYSYLENQFLEKFYI